MYNNCRLLDWQLDKISVVVGELSTLYHLLLFFDSIFGRRDLLIFKDLRDRKGILVGSLVTLMLWSI